MYHKLRVTPFLILALCASGGCARAQIASASASAATPARAAAGVSLPYKLDRAAQVSINIYDASGKVVRELLHAAPRKAGANVESWDGLDEKGQPVTAGRYSWKLLSTQGLKAEYLLSLGTNPTPRWATWPGNHNGVWAVARDQSGVYFGGVGEGPPPLLKQTASDEKRLWELPHWLEAWQGAVDLALANGNVLMLQGNGKLQIVDAQTGKHTGTWDIIWEEKDRDFTRDRGSTQVLDMDARGEQLVASYANHDAIRWLNPADGKVIDQAAVPEPLGIALAPDKRVLVISKNSVVSLSRAEKTPKTLISGLTSPWRLAVDARSGDIFVAERGAGQQVKRFSKTGAPLKVYGPRGGRVPNGLYNPMGFLAIANITADDAGGFYTCEWETAPRRTAHFDAAGKLLREWYGGQMYANFASADPADPTLVWTDSNWGGLIQAKVDYARKSWAVRATYQFQGLADGLISGSYHGSGRWFARRRGNDLYLVREGHRLKVLKVDEKNRRLMPVLVSDSDIRHDFDMKSADSPTLKRIVEAQAQRPATYTWADANGDGRVQDDEMKFAFATQLLAERAAKAAPVAAAAPLWGNAAKDKEILDLLQWAATGAPHFIDVQTKLDPMPADITGADNRSETRWWRDEAGNRFHAINTEGAKVFGHGFWGGRVGGNRVLKWDKTGKLLWEVGRHAAGSQARPGEAKYFWRIIGSVHGSVVVGDVENYAAHVWDKDGLWVGRLLENPDLKAAPISAYSNGTENFGGSMYQNPKTGEVLYFGSDANNSPVYRISGWNQFGRQSGQLTLTPQMAASLQARAQTEATRADVVRIAHIGPVQVDGDLAEWKEIQPQEIKDGDQVRATVRLGWNSTFLFAAFDINAGTPWKSAGSEQLAFQGGASVDVRLGPLEPRRTAAMSGDARYVAAPIGGKTALVEFMPLLAPGEDGRRPATYQTGNGTVTFERVASLPQDWVSSKAKPDGGTIVELRIPMRPYLATQPGLRLLLDAGVTLSNADGTASALRLPLFSRDSGDMATQDVYTESLLRPQNWAEAVLE